MKHLSKLTNQSLLIIICTLIFVSAISAEEVIVLDNGNSRLYKTSRSTAHVKTDITSQIGIVGGIAVAETSGDIYYTTGSNGNSGQIIRVNSDGTNETVVASGLNFPTAITIDNQNSMLYFVQTSSSIPSIYKVGISGTPAPQLVISGITGLGPIDLDIDVLTGYLYWTDSRGSSVRRGTTSGTLLETVANNLSSSISGIAVDSTNGFVYWLDDALDQVSYVSLNTPFPANPVAGISSTLIGIGGLQIDTSQNPTQVYWTNESSIVATAPLGGTAESLLVLADGAAQPVDLGLFFPSVPTPTPTPVSTVLTPGTVISSPPAVTVSGKKATLILQNFSSAVESAISASYLQELEKAAASAGLTIRYDVRVNAAKKKDSKKLLSKRNELTVKNLKAGNYNTTYSVVAYSKKSKSQIQKAKSQGKTGFTASFKKEFSTNFSPTASFTIN